MVVLVPGLFFLTLNSTGNAAIVQMGADSLLGFIQDASVRLYLFEGLIILSFLIVGVYAIRKEFNRGYATAELQV